MSFVDCVVPMTMCLPMYVCVVCGFVMGGVVQTLGHLGQMLQWPRFGGMRDTHDVLLVGSQEVYGFIEKVGLPSLHSLSFS
jgi:hypothetical protein